MREFQLWKVGLLVLLSGALACAQQPGQPPLPQMPANGGDVYRDQIIASERAGLEAQKSGDTTVFAAAASDDALFVDSHGTASKAEKLKELAGLRLTEYTMTGVRFVPVSAEGGLVSYTLTESGSSQGKKFSARFYVSSVWVRSGRQFVCVFSQETVAPAVAAK